MTVVAKGESEPVVPNDSAANRALNRRVTIAFRERRAAAGRSRGAEPSCPGQRASRAGRRTGSRSRCP
nr:hypothetical protein GCM10020092_048770 [Actinoplanes digitatis]